MEGKDASALCLRLAGARLFRPGTSNIRRRDCTVIASALLCIRMHAARGGSLLTVENACAPKSCPNAFPLCFPPGAWDAGRAAGGARRVEPAPRREHHAGGLSLRGDFRQTSSSHQRRSLWYMGGPCARCDASGVATLIDFTVQFSCPTTCGSMNVLNWMRPPAPARGLTQTSIFCHSSPS